MPYGGYEGYVGWKEETSYGIPVTGTYSVEVITDLRHSLNLNNVLLRPVGSRLVKAVLPGQKETQVVVTYNPASTTLLRYAIDDYTKSCTWWIKESDGISSGLAEALYYPGCQLNELVISGGPGEIVKAVATFWGNGTVRTGTPIAGASLPDPTTAGTPWQSPDQSFSYGTGGTANLIGTAVTAYSVTFNRNRERLYKFDQTLRAVPAKQFDVTGEITWTFDDMEQLKEVINNDELTIAITLGSSKILTLTGVHWQSYEVPETATDLISLRIPFVAKSATITA